jgi:gliding motility-associated lipoprotein GldH
MTSPFHHRNTQTFLICFLMGILLVTGCQKGSVYHHSVVIPANGWDMNNKLTFFDTLRTTMPTNLHRQITLRNNNAFPYQNVWIYIKTFTSDSTRVDSINWQLAKQDGSWLGNGWGSLYTHTYELPDLNFTRNDTLRWFRMELMHGLRDSLLSGISDIGLRVYTE